MRTSSLALLFTALGFNCLVSLAGALGFCASVPSLLLVEKHHRQEGIHREVCMGSHLSACIGPFFLVVWTVPEPQWAQCGTPTTSLLSEGTGRDWPVAGLLTSPQFTLSFFFPFFIFLFIFLSQGLTV